MYSTIIYMYTPTRIHTHFYLIYIYTFSFILLLFNINNMFPYKSFNWNDKFNFKYSKYSFVQSYINRVKYTKYITYMNVHVKYIIIWYHQLKMSALKIYGYYKLQIKVRQVISVLKKCLNPILWALHIFFSIFFSSYH